VFIAVFIKHEDRAGVCLKRAEECQSVALWLGKGTLVRADYPLLPFLKPDPGNDTSPLVFLTVQGEGVVMEIERRLMVLSTRLCEISLD
jgi:hypothetical protein